MKHKIILKGLFIALMLSLIIPLPLVSLAEDEVAAENDVSTEVTAADLGASANQINNATSEQTETKTVTGTLIEIGNTTADNTTVIIRTTNANGQTEDQTVEVQPATTIQNASGGASDLSDWIAGDQITYTADTYTNSGSIISKNLKNMAFKWYHVAKNGWVIGIRPDENELDVRWNNQTYTLNTADAHMVSGLNNPATLNDFKIGDRVRGRVIEDNDGNPLTWKAEILVVLRRGNDLFMRVTRWVVPARVYSIPEDVSLPTTIEVKILPSAFYQANDVNNLIGAPGDIIKVDINDSTHLVRKYFGQAYLKEFSEGDELKIIGRRDETSGHLIAKFIKNNSIQKLGTPARLGKVDAINASADNNTGTIDITLVNTRQAIRNWTVNVLSWTKIYKAGELITINDIQIGDVIRARGGTLNSNTFTINAATINVLVPIATPTD